MTVPDISRLFAACYSLVGSDRAWLLGLVELLRPMLDCGFGVGSWEFRVRDWWSEPAVGIDPEIAELMLRVGSAAPAAVCARFFLGARARPACERLRWPAGVDAHPAGRLFREPGIRDFNTLSLVDTSGAGLVFAAPSPRILKSTRQSRARLERVGAHILAGFRLRKALTAGGPNAPRDAIRILDRTRSRARPIDADGALAGFRSLIAGSWSLVESFESDGRRYLVARHNPNSSMAASALAALEAQALVMRAQGASYKVIAHELGVSPASAHRMAQAGMRKVGVRNESELPLLVRACATLPSSFAEVVDG